REVEMPEIDDLVAPEFRAHGLGHSERVDVENSPADAELRDIFDHRHSLESDGLQMRRKFSESMRITFPKLDAKLAQRARHSSFLEQRATRGQENSEISASQPLERLDSLTRDFHVRLCFAKPFARRIERLRG